MAACNPAVGSDDCVLSDGDAAKYSIKNVLGDLDGYDPVERTMQIDAVSGNDADKDLYNSDTWDDNIEIDDDRLQWNSHPSAGLHAAKERPPSESTVESPSPVLLGLSERFSWNRSTALALIAPHP